MTAPDALTTTRELLQGLLQQGWQPTGYRPDDCGAYRTLVDPVWDAWTDS